MNKFLIIVPILSVSLFATTPDDAPKVSKYQTFVDKIYTDFKDFKDLKLKKYKLYSLAGECIEKSKSKHEIRVCENILRAKLNVVKKEEFDLRKKQQKDYLEQLKEEKKKSK